VTIRASFAPSNFRREVVSAWLNFYVMAATEPEARRLLTVYQRRLRSNLLHGLRPLAGDRAPEIAERIAGLIDGLYLRAALDAGALHGEQAAAHVLAALEGELRGCSILNTYYAFDGDRK
jgi:TetR/AcrR family transcriptional repressor of bet genes